MKTKLYLLVMLFAVAQIGNGQNTWVQKTSFPGVNRVGEVSFGIGTKGYLGMGTGGPGLLFDFWEYEQLNDAWTQKATCWPITYAVGFSIGSKGYVVTGSDGSGQYDIYWKYDPSTNIWDGLSTFSGGYRVHAVSFSMGGKGYMGTGKDFNGIYHNDFWEYDPISDSWTQKASVGGQGRQFAVGFSISGKGYIGTGNYYNGSNFIYFNDFWEYDASSNIWTQKAHYPGSGCAYATGFSISNKGYIGLGMGSTSFNQSFCEYNPVSNTWTQRTPLPGIIATNAIGININNKGYVELNNGSNDFWEYTPCIQPSAAISPSGPTSFCQGGSVVLNATVQSNCNYHWRKNGTNISGATLVSYTATTSGSYTVTVTDTSGACNQTTATATIVTVKPVSSAAVTAQGPTTFCAGDSVVLVTNTSNGLTYKWKKGINYISGATKSSYSAKTAGTYRAEVTNKSGCTTTSAGVMVTVPCREGEEAASENSFNITVYPNPSAGDFTVAFGSSIETGSVEVYSSLNEKVFEVPIQNESKKEIHLKNNSKGIYFVSVRSGKDRVGGKMVEVGN